MIALQVFVPDSGAVELNDTLLPRARALNGRGDSVSATIIWAALDTAVVTVLDSTTGATRGDSVAEGRIQARVGNLRSSPLPIRVQSPADSIRPAGSVRDTVDLAAGDSLSDTLAVRVWATPDNLAANRVGRRVAYSAAIYPSTGTTVTLQPKDTVLTGTSGIAIARLRLTSGQPDSVVVTAVARRADGQPVPGPSVTFVVEFRP